jgi:hypothetical protein
MDESPIGLYLAVIYMMPTALLEAGDPSVHQLCEDAVHSKSVHQHGPPPIMSLLQYALWLRDNAIDHIRRVLFGVLKAGPIPQHVAFIMDGNRRYARDKGVKVIQGHVDGFVALRRVRAHTMHGSQKICKPLL